MFFIWVNLDNRIFHILLQCIYTAYNSIIYLFIKNQWILLFVLLKSTSKDILFCIYFSQDQSKYSFKRIFSIFTVEKKTFFLSFKMNQIKIIWYFVGFFLFETKMIACFFWSLFFFVIFFYTFHFFFSWNYSIKRYKLGKINIFNCHLKIIETSYQVLILFLHK